MEKLTWRTQEYLHREKSTDWYWIVGIVTISIGLIAIILNNIIFAILVIISSATLTLFASKPPATIDIEIDGAGVKVGNKIYKHKDIAGFWVETRDNHDRALLRLNKTFSPLVVIFIEDVEPETVRLKLERYVKEEEQSEPLLEKLLIYLGF